jgi:hypothetical protein
MPLHAEAPRKSASTAPLTARASAANAPAVAASPAVQRLQDLSRSLNARPEVVAQRALGDKLSAASAARLAPANRTGLPDALKTGVEALSGQSMDDVRVHRNSGQPAQLQAHAYAQGTDIHLAPGQERHLPHEAWHVVQQKQGRVRPTMQLEGAAINDDSGLEREADVMGGRALQAKRAEPGELGIASTGTGGVVQRAIGFEFETGNAIKHPDGENIAKEHVYVGEQFHIDADTKNKHGHNIEFVTEPQAGVEEAEVVIEGMAEFAGQLASGPKDNGEGWTGDYELTITDQDWEATMQHTEGVLFAEMANFIRFTTGNAEDHSHFAAMAEIDERHADLELSDSVKGLIHLVLHYLRVLKAWDGKNNEEGPKNAGAIMSRTDFRSMFLALGAEEQVQFVERIGAELAAAGFDPNKPVIPKQYLQYRPGVDQPELKKNETTISQWLSSMSKGIDYEDGEHVDKDLFSPPEGYESFEPAYSMGAMGMDGDRVVIEVRDHGNSTSLTRDAWVTAPGLVARGLG